MRRLLLLLALVPAAMADEPMHHQAAPPAPHDHHFSASFESLWESRYVSEGTDNLDGAGILSELLTVRWGHFHTDVWQGIGYDTNFAELNVLGVFDFHLGPVDLYVSLNHKRFFHSDRHDNEIGGGMVYRELPAGCFAALDWYHSFEIEGSYAEASLGGEWDWRGVTFRPIVALGCNADYLPEADNGLNSLMPRLDVAVPLTDELKLIAYAAYNVPLNETAEGFFWGGVGVKATY